MYNMSSRIVAMATRINQTAKILFFLISLASIISDSIAVESRNGDPNVSRKYNPYSPRASLLRYWNTHIKNNNPQPSFLMSKASPLTASHSAHLKDLATKKDLSSNHAFFCHFANLFCLPDEQQITVYSEGNQLSNESGQVSDSNGMQFANYNLDFAAYEINKNNTGSSFTNYSDETNFGLAIFKDYSKEGGSSTSFKNYSEGASFAQYGDNSTEPPEPPEANLRRVMKSSLVEPGKFFREAELTEGNVMPMPDIRDKFPRRSFLPRSILSELPFSSSRIKELKEVFHASDNSTMEWVILNALNECERDPSHGETKTCVGSIEDMIDFATSILGNNVAVRSTENVDGSSKHVMIGPVKAVNGGKLTKAVSCHQSLYPYLLYYCHSVPNVRVYEADILDVISKQRINHGVAICHLDTSVWNPRHAAFLALGYGPGKIEVCHWIFENDMTWTWDN